MAILMTEDLARIYHYNYNCIHAISNCNIRIERGEFVAINGVRGSGKTTLLRLLGGIDRPSSGKVYLNQIDIYSMNDKELTALYRKEIGFIFQDYKLISGLNIYDNIVMPSLLNQCNLDKDYMKDLTDGLHITNILNSYPKYITKEQQQCVTIARALMNQPEIILADEPTKNLNDKLRKDILDFFMNYIDWNNKTLIMVTNEPEISVFADHVIRLDYGKIITDRRIRKLRNE